MPPDARIGSSARRLLVAVGAVALGVALVAASRSSMLHARSIDVVGTHHLTREQVVRAAGLSPDTNVLWLDESAVERRLEAMPWVADAHVRVAFPFTIHVEVIERVPVAVARDGAGLMLMAGDGTALGRVVRPGELPVIQLAAGGWVEGVRPGPVGAARALVQLRPALRRRIATVTVLLDGTLELRIEGGPKVRFGSTEDARAKGRSVDRLLRWAQTQQEPLREISVVEAARPAVTTA